MSDDKVRDALEQGQAFYEQHVWSGCNGSRWERLTQGTQDIAATAERMLATIKADAWDECCRQMQLDALNAATHEAGGRLRRRNPYRAEGSA